MFLRATIRKLSIRTLAYDRPFCPLIFFHYLILLGSKIGKIFTLNILYNIILLGSKNGGDFYANFRTT